MADPRILPALAGSPSGGEPPAGGAARNGREGDMPPARRNPCAHSLVRSVGLAVLAYFARRREMRGRATLYGAFLIACVVVMWPPYGRDDKPGKIHLGLDLK